MKNILLVLCFTFISICATAQTSPSSMGKNTVFGLNINQLTGLSTCTEQEFKTQQSETGCKHQHFFDSGRSIHILIIPNKENDLPFPAVFGFGVKPSTLEMILDKDVSLDTVLNYLTTKYGNPTDHQILGTLETYKFKADTLQVTLTHQSGISTIGNIAVEFSSLHP